MTITANFPSIRPTLLLDFANTEVLDPRITFSRPTTATYYDAKTSAVAEQNLLLNSQAFNSSPWVKSTSTVADNSVTAPDGTTTAATITFTNGATSTVYQPSSSASLTVASYTASCYFKSGTDTTITFSLVRNANTDGASCAFNLAAGTAGAVTNYGATSGATAAISSAGNGWYRCSITLTATTSSTWYVINTGTTAGNTVLAWGAQLEQRSSATAYTPTTTTAITNYIPVLQTASSNTARFDHDPVTKSSLGLLIEEQRTNLLTYSSAFDNAAWNKGFATITTAANIAPDGTQTAQKLVDNSTTQQHQVYATVASVSGVNTFSVYMKAAEITSATMFINSTSGGVGYATFNLSAGTVAVTTGTIVASATITAVGNNWYKCSITTASLASATAFPAIITNTPTLYAGNGYNGIYIWGAQLEAGSFATSYIPTVASQVTRSADVATMTGTNFSNWYNNQQGTVYSEAKSFGISSAAMIGQLYLSATNYIDVGRYQSTLKSVILSNNTTVATLDTGIAIGSFNKFSVSYTNNSYNASGNAGTVQTSSSGLVPNGINTLNIGNYQGNNLFLNGYIKKLAYYPLAITNAQLQGLTG